MIDRFAQNCVPGWRSRQPGVADLRRPKFTPTKLARSSRLAFNAGVLFLLIAVLSLSAAAKNSRYLPKSDPGSYISQASRMQQRSTTGECETGIPADTASEPLLAVSAPESSDPPVDEGAASPRVSALLCAEQLRSPPCA